MTGQTEMVFVVDDDDSVRKALMRLLTGAGYAVDVFASAAEFLNHELPDVPACAVLDLSMPGMDGLKLQARLADEELALGVVFLSGHGDIPATVRAMRQGAVDFLTKPVDEDILLAAISTALAEQHRILESHRASSEANQRFITLSKREREVMELVVKGQLNKQIAAELGISEKTVKVHRARVMQKTSVRSLAELVKVRIAATSTEQ